jgi:iron(III) transport system ATP-binding protein
MLAEFRAFHARAASSTLYITHDQAEAMSLADRIAVMDQGRLLQVAAPEELYRAPNALPVARFIGLSTLVPGRVASGTINGTCRIEALGTVLDGTTASDLRTGGGAVVVVRPEAEGGIPARVVTAVYQGGRFLVECETSGGVTLKTYLATRPRPGEAIRLAIAPSWVLPGDAPDQRSVAQGSTPAGKRLEIA